jgi:hypothetical protein
MDDVPAAARLGRRRLALALGVTAAAVFAAGVFALPRLATDSAPASLVRPAAANEPVLAYEHDCPRRDILAALRALRGVT